MANNQIDFDFGRYTPLDSTKKEYSIFNSAYKNIRFSLPFSKIKTINAADMANLPGIAFDEYGDTSLWRLILAYNGFQDPVQDIYPGVTIKIPSKADVISHVAKQQNNNNPSFTI